MNNQILQQAATSYATPSYIFDLDAFTSRIGRMKQILGEQVRIYYAMKANPFLTKSAARAADGLEVCSPGEYDICRRAGIPARKIVLSGVNKEELHTTAVIREQGAHTYTAESPGQLDLLEKGAACAGAASLRVLLRLTSGNQFGMDEDTILRIIRGRGSYPHLNLVGLQYYSGTQKRGIGKILRELMYLDHFLETARVDLGFEFGELEYGPGFPITYFQGQDEVDEDALLLDFKKGLDSLAFKGIIVLEAGRFLAAPCGSYITRVVDIKRSQGQGYCIVDGGINHVNYYGQAMAMKIPAHRYLPQDRGQCLPEEQGSAGPCTAVSRRPPEEETWAVCGSLCTSGDILVKNLPLPGLKTGDLLVFDRIGAYSVTEGIYLFLSRKLPAVLTYSKEGGLQLVRHALPTDILNEAGSPAIEPPITVPS